MDQAERKIIDVLSKDDSVLEARYILGNIYMRQEKYNEASVGLKRLMDIDPKYTKRLLNLGDVYEE